MSPGIISSVVKRHLKSTDHFVSTESGARCPAKIEPRAGEDIIGWYANPPGEEDATLVFTTEAIHVVRPTGTERLAIDEIASCSQPDSKENPKGLSVVVGGQDHFLPAAGSHGEEGQFKDAYNLFSAIRGLLPAERT